MCWAAARLALPQSPRHCALWSEHSPGGTEGPPVWVDYRAVLSPGAQGRWFSPRQRAEEPDLFNACWRPLIFLGISKKYSFYALSFWSFCSISHRLSAKVDKGLFDLLPAAALMPFWELHSSAVAVSPQAAGGQCRRLFIANPPGLRTMMVFLEVTSPGHVQCWAVARFFFFFKLQGGSRAACRVGTTPNASVGEISTFLTAGKPREKANGWCSGAACCALWLSKPTACVTAVRAVGRWVGCLLSSRERVKANPQQELADCSSWLS